MSKHKTGSTNLLGNVLEALVRAAYNTVNLAIMGSYLELIYCEAAGKRVNVDGKDGIIHLTKEDINLASCHKLYKHVLKLGIFLVITLEFFDCSGQVNTRERSSYLVHSPPFHGLSRAVNKRKRGLPFVIYCDRGISHTVYSEWSFCFEDTGLKFSLNTFSQKQGVASRVVQDIQWTSLPSCLTNHELCPTSWNWSELNLFPTI